MLSGPVGPKEIRGHIDVYIDPDWQRTVPDMMGEYAGQFKPVTTNVPDFGYTKSSIWLRMKTENLTEAETNWLLYFHENFKQIFEVYLVREDGRIENPLKLGLESRFSERPIPFPEMVAPLTLQPSETATILIRYWSEGSSGIGFSFETPTSFAAIASSRTAKHFVYYGMTILLIVAALLAMMIFRHRVFLAYSAYATSTLLFILHSDGVAFQYLWPNLPQLNNMASVFTGSSIIIFGANYARVFLQTSRRHPVMDKILLMIIFVAVAMVISTTFVDNQLIKKLFVLLALVAIIFFTISGLLAARTRFKEVRFYVFAWAGAVLSALIMTMRHWLGVEISQDFQYDSMRIVMVFDATMMGLAIADRYNQLRRSQQAVMRASLKQAKQNLDLNRRFSSLEEQYNLAQELSKSQTEEIQNTVHDLRQPLHALRLNVKNLLDSDTTSETSRANLANTFSYLETLISKQLQAPLVNSISTDTAEAELTQLRIKDVLESIHEMFVSDATKKGLEFKLQTNNPEAPVDPLVLMRIVSNLVSNAIKYTNEGHIELGTRSSDDAITVYVKDTGTGLTQDEFEIAKQRDQRLSRNKDQASGQGFGLAIAANLAAQNGLSLHLGTPQTPGSEVVLLIPK